VRYTEAADVVMYRAVDASCSAQPSRDRDPPPYVIYSPWRLTENARRSDCFQWHGMARRRDQGPPCNPPASFSATGSFDHDVPWSEYNAQDSGPTHQWQALVNSQID